MDLWQLHIFCKVVEYKSFSKAGKAVHLSQPTVSSHIRDLEDHFGCRLIDRLARKASPTKAGDLLYTYARRLISLRDETETALAEFHGRITGRLVIGGSTIPGTYILPRIVGAFTRKHPEVTVSLAIGDTEKIIQETLDGTIELGIVGAKSKDKRITQEKMIEDDMRLIVPADHPWAGKETIPVSRLLAEPFISRERGSGTLKSIQISLSHGAVSMDAFTIVAEMGSTEAVCQGIKNGVGISILSTLAVAEELQAGTLKALAIEGVDLKRAFYLTTHKSRSPSPLCMAFLAFIRGESHGCPPITR
ncbi:MAG: selenium metabolism-associated LysR family transcriptional regulator [Desulfobacterales bacterium]